VNIVYEDDDLLIVNKPPGVVIDREHKPPGGEKFLVVHRLDKETSGLLVLAKTPEAAENLKKQFQERKIKKGYWALVHGRLTHPSGVIDKPIGRAPKGVGKFVVTEEGRPSVTRYVAAGPWPAREMARQGRAATHGVTLLDVQPLTGRTHQIRVHLKSIGHPIVGDKIYASRRQQKEDTKVIQRQFLHAYRLSLSQPRTGEWLAFEIDLPKDLKKVLSNLKSQMSKLKTTC
jgi:23S rRNA pseudouridine1911/1915/1917 synthase